MALRLENGLKIPSAATPPRGSDFGTNAYDSKRELAGWLAYGAGRPSGVASLLGHGAVEIGLPRSLPDKFTVEMKPDNWAMALDAVITAINWAPEFAQ